MAEQTLKQAEAENFNSKKYNTVKSKGNRLVGLQGLPIIGEQPKSEREEEYLREMVEYEFFNLEEPGLIQTFSYGTRGNIHKFTLLHGGKYILPRFIARHIESRATPIWKWKPDGLGSMMKEKIGVNPRFRMSAVFK